MREVVTRRTLSAAFVCGLVGVSLADGSPASRALTKAGYAFAYDLKFASCYDVLASASVADPRDPAPRRAIAAVTWMEILFAQGVATFEAFTGEISKNDVVRPPTPKLLAQRFLQSIKEAADLAEQQQARADDADAYYQVGATAALSTLYGATVEGRTLGALSQGRRAVAAMESARSRAPGLHEAALVLGMSEYTVSTMSWPVRMLARLAGLSGDRAAGLALMEEAATRGTETETDALLILMIVENREGRPVGALERLAYMQQRHPGNRLLWLNRGATALAAHRPQEADQVLTDGIGRHDLRASPAVLGEKALWFAHRGTARAALHHDAAATDDLLQGLLSDPRDWVRGRIHARLGDLALGAGDRVAARRQFEAAVEFSARGGDRSAVNDAKQALQSLGH